MFPAAHTPGHNTHYPPPSINDHVATGKPATTVPTTRSVAPDISVKLSPDPDGIAINVSPAVQSLLGLNHGRVILGPHLIKSDFTQTETGSYNHNIPAEDRVYVHESDRQLMWRYINAYRTANVADYRHGDVFAHDRLRGNILFALEKTPGREDDVLPLRLAFRRIEVFLLGYDAALAAAVASRPDLRSQIEAAAAESLDHAMVGALQNRSVYHQRLSVEDLVATASAAVASQDQQRSKDFYAGPNPVVGAGKNATRDDIDQLARGRIHFPDLQSLLAFAPIGILRYEHQNRDYYNPLTRKLEQRRWTEPRVTYPGRQVTQLSFLEHPGTPREWNIPVITGADGYILNDGALTSYPVAISPTARKENLERLDLLIQSAAKRLVRG